MYKHSKYPKLNPSNQALVYIKEVLICVCLYSYSTQHSTEQNF